MDLDEVDRVVMERVVTDRLLQERILKDRYLRYIEVRRWWLGRHGVGCALMAMIWRGCPQVGRVRMARI